MVERKKDEMMQTADDVATLYSWANLHGAKYRDFSASRQELRAQSRHRMLAEQDALAQEAVDKAEQEKAKPAEAAAKPEPTVAATTSARSELRPEMRPLGESIHGQPKATVQYERMPATPVERKPASSPAASAAPTTRSSEPIQAQAPHIADDFGYRNPPAERWPEAARSSRLGETQYREQPISGQQYLDQQFAEQQFRDQQYREQQYRDQQYRDQQYRDQAYREQQYREQAAADARYAPPADRRSPNRGPEFTPAVERRTTRDQDYNAQSPWSGQPGYPAFDRRTNRGPEFAPAVERRMNREPDFNLQSRPAWMGQENEAAYNSHPGGETLQQSRERVASRWFALKGVFDQSNEQAESQMSRGRDVRVPALAVFSLAGGVGKTSLVATLGRSLSALGERVLLADTSSYGLLPYYFGARDLRPGVVRTFSPPGGGSDAPVNLLNVDIERHEGDPSDMDWLAQDLQRNAKGSNRILIDLATASASLTRRALRTTPVVLVPIIPDMNSIVTLTVVDGFFRNHHDAEGRPVQPYYVLNQFDPSLPLHLDVREVLRQQLGDRLLPFVLRRTQAVSEALAEGMTVVDYAPNSTVADDYQHLANWLRSVSAPASLGYRGMRWSER